MENSKYRRTGTGGGRDGPTNTGVTRKLGNHLKGIQNPILRNPDNPFKEIRNIAPTEIQSQWTRGLNIPT